MLSSLDVLASPLAHSRSATTGGAQTAPKILVLSAHVTSSRTVVAVSQLGVTASDKAGQELLSDAEG